MHISFWEQDAMLDADFMVIGGGMIGLQTALALRNHGPQHRIVLLERGLLPAGASSRNAGFACFGSLTEILSDLQQMGESAALALVERRWRGLQRLRQRLGDAAMGYEPFGGFELLLESQVAALEQLADVNAKLTPIFKQNVFTRDDAGLRHFGPRVKALIRNPLEGQVHSGRLMRSLATLAAENRIEIHTGAEVTAFDPNGREIHVKIAGQRSLTFRAPRIAVCTNGLTGTLLPHLDIVPARGQVLMTAPIPDLPWRGAYHLDAGFYYFRNVGQRVLLGGGRHLDLAAETSSAMVLTPTIQSTLEDLLRDTILPGQQPAIDYRWAGVMGFSADKQPMVKRLSEQVVLGFGCNGMGVALSAEIAAQTAQLLLE